MPTYFGQVWVQFSCILASILLPGWPWDDFGAPLGPWKWQSWKSNARRQLGGNLRSHLSSIRGSLLAFFIWDVYFWSNVIVFFFQQRFLSILGGPGTALKYEKTWNSSYDCRKSRNQGLPKAEKTRPENTFGFILNICLVTWGNMYLFCLIL